MISLNAIRKLVNSFPEVTEAPHFEKTSFKVKKKIFATYDNVQKIACVKLSAIDQDVFSSVDRMAIYPVKNAWGKKGWTIIELKKVKKDLVVDALTTAYCSVASGRN
ncbi:MAG TPA: hypothetical protein DIW47_03955 [Bacteroidetes bacterium]|nr:hypothetical protein [Bacteroidota bacterium]